MAIHSQNQESNSIFTVLVAGITEKPPSCPILSHRGKEGKKKNSNRPTMNGPKLNLKLNLSPPPPSRHNPRVESPSRSMTASPASSCVSSEMSQAADDSSGGGSPLLRYSSSPEATSMMLAGCPRCLMYVMLAEEDPRCPKCKSTVLLEVVQIQDNNCTTTTVKTTKGKP